MNISFRLYADKSIPMKKIFYIICGLLIFLTNVHAADEEKKEDTLLFEPSTLLDKAAPVTDSTDYEKHLLQTPTVALFKSMVVPGWGQYGNNRKFKALIYFSIDVYMISKAIHYKKKASDLWDKYDASSDVPTRNSYYELYTQEKKRRNKFTWYAVITSFFSMFDAYVDAHLSGFPQEKEKKLSFDIQPMETSGALVSLSLHF